LRDKVALVSAQLDAMGCRRGEHVAMLMDNGLWTAILLLTVMASGRVAVPLNAIAGDGQLEYVLDHCDANILFASGEHEARANWLADRLRRPVSVIPACPDQGPQWPTAEQAEVVPLEPLELE